MSEIDTGANLHTGAQSVREIASLLGTPTTPEPEQPTGEQDVKIEPGEKKTPDGDNEPNPNRFTAKLGDQDIDFECLTEGVDLKLIQKGMMLEIDYRKKTAEVAEERRLNEGVRTDLDAALKDAKLLIEMDLDALEANKTLKEDDPEEYVKQLDSITKRAKTYSDRKAAQDKASATKADQNRVTQKQLLDDAIPDWLDETVKNSEISLMVKAMESAGFDTDAIGAIDDHKIFLLARKAALYDQIMSKDLKAKLDDTPGKNLTPGKANDKTDIKISSARERLKTGGKVKDLALVFSET